MKDIAKVLNGGIDGRGLAIDIPDDQLDMAAAQLGALDNALELTKGDVYILKCTALGVKPGERSDLTSPIDRRGSEIEEFCALMGTNRKTAENWAALCRKWERGDRVIGIPLSFYGVVAGMEREAARQLLLKAQMGDPTTDWEHTTGKQPEKPWRMWSQSRLKAERQKLEGTYIEKPDVSTAKDAVFDVVESAVAKLPAAKQAPVRNAIKKGIAKEFQKLQTTYTQSVKAAAAVQAQAERERLVAAREKYEGGKDNYERLVKGVAKTITKEEYRVLVQFCHPDKNPGNEAKARKAEAIVRKIGEQLLFVK